MIHLNTNTGEKEKIVSLITNTIDKPDYELECLLYENTKNFKNPSIKHANFMSILKRYKGNPNFISKTNERLAISF